MNKKNLGMLKQFEIIDLHTMTAQVIEQIQKYSTIGTKPWTYETAVKDLPVQVGSLTKLIMQLQGERYAHGMTELEIKNKISDELSDILSLTLYIAHELNIDLDESWGKMLTSDDEKVSQRTKK